MHAIPVLKVTPLPPVLDVNPIESVSAICGFTSSNGISSTSANCWETVALVPPISGDPSARVTIPSGVTVATALDGPLLLPQKPLATPRPRYGPSNVAE